MSTSSSYEPAARGAADLAAVAVLLQIGAELGVDRFLDSGDGFTAGQAADAAGLPAGGVEEYLRALVAADLAVADAAGRYRAAADYADRRYEAGYVSWAMSANYPFVEHARSFLTDPAGAAGAHPRDGRRVAVSSRWVGERAFYPGVFEYVSESGARRITDLGAGAGGLLIRLLLQDPARSGVALDISSAACDAAREAAARAGVADRLEVTERPIESLVEDPGPVDGAEAVQACFVMHDVVADEPLFAKLLGTCREALAPGGFLAVVDAVSYAPDPAERRFSALFTYLHANFMDIALPAEEQWLEKFRAAGFSSVRCLPQPMPGSRLFVAAK
ncbi:class I SAM-dependent methyltransferase [Streptomyces smaragdinus]|uniref:class I SAM-dependent methyltransferase n=1 Tax=Streptomyces smaragdinus TaxID=2585196 RepID=UPI001295BDFF|nr:class I SAM-dependent methyltransferase [Streptomyces smaragdinus]